MAMCEGLLVEWAWPTEASPTSAALGTTIDEGVGIAGNTIEEAPPRLKPTAVGVADVLDTCCSMTAPMPAAVDDGTVLC